MWLFSLIILETKIGCSSTQDFDSLRIHTWIIRDYSLHPFFSLAPGWMRHLLHPFYTHTHLLTHANTV
jgi:hypothetical protein